MLSRMGQLIIHLVISDMKKLITKIEWFTEESRIQRYILFKNHRYFLKAMKSNGVFEVISYVNFTNENYKYFQNHCSVPSLYWLVPNY